MMDLFNLVAKLTLDKSEYEAGLSGLDKGLGSVAKVGAAAVAATTGAVVAFGASSVAAGQEFDKAMAQVAATSGKSVDEIGELREFALEMGSTTAFSATQAAEALNYMALAGYDAQTSMNMLPTVLNLAAAGDMELATASDMVTDAQTALGLEIEQTKDMVDQMAKASATTNTSVAQLGDAFLTVGGNAKTLSGGTAELSSVLGAMADNGIKGSEAGTHLRNIILDLNPKTDAAAESWKQLGVEAYDAQGNLRPLEDVFMELDDAMSGMTDQEKTDIISKMFNKTDLAAVNALLATDAERWGEIDQAIGNAQGSAEQMAETQLDNLAGDMTLFQSALEGVKIAISDGLTPILRNVVQTATTGLSSITEKIREYIGSEETQAKLNKIADAVKSLMGIIIDNLDNIFNLAVTVITGIMNVVGFLIDHIEIVKTVIGAIAGAWVAIKALGIISTIANVIGVITSVIGTIGSVGGAILALINPVTLIIAAIAGAAIAIVANWDKIKAAWGVAVEFFKGVWSGITDAFKNIGTWIADKFTSAWDKIKNAWSAVTGFFSDIKDKIINAFKNLDEKFMEVGRNLLSGLWNGIKEKASSVIEGVKGIGSSILSGINKVFGNASPSKEFKKIGGYLMQGLANGITDSMGAVEDAMDDLDSMMYSDAPTSDLATETTTTAYGETGDTFKVAQKSENKNMTVILQLDRTNLAKAVYQLNSDETQRVGVKLAGGYA